MRLRILAAVAKYLGHNSTQLVMRYSHLVPEVKARTFDARPRVSTPIRPR
jgi:hypothetical protein